jgi:hypothetical protein
LGGAEGAPSPNPGGRLWKRCSTWIAAAKSSPAYGGGTFRWWRRELGRPSPGPRDPHRLLGVWKSQPAWGGHGQRPDGAGLAAAVTAGAVPDRHLSGLTYGPSSEVNRQREALRTELSRELNVGHVLDGRAFSASLAILFFAALWAVMPR